MNPVFCRFESFNFESDPRFSEGLKSFNKSQEEEEEAAAQLLDLKLFFYNRFVEPIDRSGYKQQKSSSSPPPPLPPTETWRRSDSAGGEDAAAETPAHTQQEEQLSFGEVMRLLQEGKEVPGVCRVEVQASNQSPTPSRMQRVAKPWEASTSQ